MDLWQIPGLRLVTARRPPGLCRIGVRRALTWPEGAKPLAFIPSPEAAPVKDNQFSRRGPLEGLYPAANLGGGPRSAAARGQAPGLPGPG
jgi:hypothetical protein